MKIEQKIYSVCAFSLSFSANPASLPLSTLQETSQEPETSRNATTCSLDGFRSAESRSEAEKKENFSSFLQKVSKNVTAEELRLTHIDKQYCVLAQHSRKTVLEHFNSIFVR